VEDGGGGGGGIVGGGPGDSDGGGFGAGDSGGSAGTGECNASTQYVYVVNDANTLYSFAPETLTFTPIGQLNCAAGGATPTSMGVDRNGTAWVLLSDGTINQVSTKDGSCKATTYAPGQAGFMKFGMGFSTAKVDLKSYTLSTIGPYSGILKGVTSELTGTGDGKLYGFFVTSPATVAEIDKTNGNILTMNQVANTYAGTAWAFAFYGGAFYIFTADNSGGGLPKDGTGSDVTLYKPSDNSSMIVKGKIGFTIVGAGVSTCVPTTGVK
jgi:hypothetical protein